MPLTPEEILQRRLTDPYFSLAESLSKPSLSDQKKASLAAASVEKERNMDPAASIANDQHNIEQFFGETAPTSGLLDVAESGLYQAGSHLADFVTPGASRTNEEIRQAADERAGLTPEARQRLVTDPQQQVIESLAAGDYLGAVPEAIAAGPGTLAESASFLPELAAGALLTRFGGKAGKRIVGQKVKKKTDKIFEAIDRARKSPVETALEKAATVTPKAAGQVSIATADITQRQNNDFRAEHGRDMNRNELATSYAINLATMMPQPAILKNFFVPKFKQQIGKEIKTLGKNIIGGSNARNVAVRVADGTKKVLAASGAEAAQEYFQTWAENINVQMGPEERKNFFESAMEVFGDEENQLQALAGTYLGGGAGGTARAAITVPAVAAGTAIDTTKGTVKTAAKATKAVTEKTARVVQKAVNKQTYKVLSEEEREVIRSEFESRKEIVDAKTREFESAVEKVKSARTLAELRGDPAIREVVQRRQEESGVSDDALESRRALEKLKSDVIRAYRGDIGLLKTELQASNVADIAGQSAKNIKSKSVETAAAAVKAVAPSVTEVIADVKRHGAKAVKAVQEIRSSTALGMIELAAHAGKAEAKQIVEAAKSLSLDDLNRATAVISDVKPEIARQLQPIIRAKQKALEKTGVRAKTIINSETLSPIIKDVAKRGNIAAKEIAQVSSELRKTVAGKIDDLLTLEQAEAVAKVVEQSEEFKKQIKGAMTRDSMVELKRKLGRMRKELEKEPGAKEKAKAAAKAVLETAAPVAKKATEKVAAKAAPKRDFSPTFRTIVKAVGETIKKPDQAQALIDSVPDFVKQVKKFGVENRSDFLAFVEEFPELQDNVEFFSKLEESFPSDVTAKEVYDNLRTIGIDNLDAVKKAYNAVNPPECKV